MLPEPWLKASPTSPQTRARRARRPDRDEQDPRTSAPNREQRGRTRRGRWPGDPVRAGGQEVPRRHGRRRVAVPGGPVRSDHRLRRAVRLRQDDVAADDQPDDRADLGPDHARRPRHRAASTRPSCGAASATSSSTPGLFPHRTVVDNVATVPLLLGQDRKQARATAMELLERVGLPDRVRQALPGPALRRPAAARRRRPSAGRRPAGDADGRAVQRRRPGGARPSCRTSSCGCRASSARPSSSSPTTSTRRSSSATRSRCCGSAATWPSSRRRPSC